MKVVPVRVRPLAPTFKLVNVIMSPGTKDILYVILVICFFYLLIRFNEYKNDYKEAECNSRGGQYFRAGVASRSLCMLPKK